VRVLAYVNEMCGTLSTDLGEICSDNSTTTFCRGAASGNFILKIISQSPHIQYLYFGSSGESDNGSHVVTYIDIDIPMGSLIIISVSSVIRQLQ
jgi:hypothetical protein